MLPARIIVRYILLQLPTLVLLVLILALVRRWVVLPVWLVCSLLALFVLKDLALFRFVQRTKGNSLAGIDSMIGRKGTAAEPLDPTGYIRVRGELWQAKVTRSELSIDMGERVRVRGVQGLRLLVEQKRRGISVEPYDCIGAHNGPEKRNRASKKQNIEVC